MTRLPQAVRGFLVTAIVGGVALGICFGALVPGVLTLAEAHQFTQNQLAQLSALSQRSTVYDAAGNVIGVLGIENREDVGLDAVPKIVQDAVISVEDKSFWTNDGVDLNGVMRAALKNATSGKIEQGGSTITQQLVKNRLLTSKRDLNRKIREIVLALRLNEKYSKRQVLEQYLNTVYFGQGSYGIKTAVERFFLKAGPGGSTITQQLKDVTVGQAALLAGVISNPEGDNPFLHPETAKARRAFALSRMLEQGYITQAQLVAAEAEPMPTIKPTADLRPQNLWTAEIQNRLFTDPLYKVLGNTLQERKDKVLKGGLKIYATEDPALQADADDAMAQVLPSAPAGFTGSLVSIEPSTGFVKAMYGGSGFGDSQYNIATAIPGRQAGSTWKVITLAAALDVGFSPADQVDGTDPCVVPGFGQTSNAEGGEGVMALRAATAGSVNCAFARTQLAVGFNKVIDTAYKMGITQKKLIPILTLTLGTIESNATEMATVAATLANGGVHHPPMFISKIVSADGTTVFDGKNVAGDRAIPQDVASCETDLLRGVVTGGTGTGAQLAGRPVAGKTGTTDNLADANFLGYTPQLATFIWHGSPKGRIPGAGFGGNRPATIFRLFMNAALANLPVVPLPDPGPDCSRPGAYISASGRSATPPADFPTSSTEAPTIVVKPTTTNPAPSTTTGPTTTTTPCVVPPCPH
jgi:penicillin-binding protein 1A